MPSVRLSALVKDYIDRRKQCAEHQSVDSALRDVLSDADDEWVEKAKQYRSRNDSD